MAGLRKLSPDLDSVSVPVLSFPVPEYFFLP